jgi:hypothetical protein
MLRESTWCAFHAPLTISRYSSPVNSVTWEELEDNSYPVVLTAPFHETLLYGQVNPVPLDQLLGSLRFQQPTGLVVGQENITVQFGPAEIVLFQLAPHLVAHPPGIAGRVALAAELEIRLRRHRGQDLFLLPAVTMFLHPPGQVAVEQGRPRLGHLVRVPGLAVSECRQRLPQGQAAVEQRCGCVAAVPHARQGPIRAVQ